MAFVFTNNAASILIAPIAAGDDELLVRTTDAEKFPSPNDPYYIYEQFALTLKDPDTLETEIVYCTLREDNLLTVDRGQEGTVAKAFPAGALVAHNLTAGVLEYLRDL